MKQLPEFWSSLIEELCRPRKRPKKTEDKTQDKSQDKNPGKSQDKSPNAKADERRKTYGWLLGVLEKKHPDLYRADVNTKPTLSEPEAIELNDYLRAKKPGFAFMDAATLLSRGLEKGKLLHGWDVVILPPPVVVPREVPRFTCESFRGMGFAREVESAFLEKLRHPVPDSRALRLGQILLSAILFGGLVRRFALKAFVEALSKIQSHERVAWLDMNVRRKRSGQVEQGDKDADTPDKKSSPATTGREIRRRWFPDPLTRALIGRARREDEKDKKDTGRRVSPPEAICEYLNTILPAQAPITKRDVWSFIKGSATRLGLHVQPFLLAVAEGRIKSVSLPPRVWLRLLTGKVPPAEVIPEGGEAGAATAPIAPPKPRKREALAANPAPFATQEVMFQELQNEIFPHDASQKRSSEEAMAAVDAYLEQNRDRMHPALRYLAEWAMDLLKYYPPKERFIRRRIKGKLMPSSTRRYLSAFGKQLIAVARDT